MTKKYFQAKKLSTNPLKAMSKKHPNSKANRLIAVCLLVSLTGIIVSAGISYFFSHKNDKVTEPKKVAKTQEAPKKKVVKPIADEDFKAAKEYNFYTQLEERSLVMDGEERFGGVALDNVNEPPKISLESAVKSQVSVPVKPAVKNNDVVMTPLVLESTVKAPVVSESKIINLQVGSFTVRKEAENQKVKLSQYGFSSRIQQGKNSAQQDIYRVQIGPFSKREIGAVKERLSALKIGYFEVR